MKFHFLAILFFISLSLFASERICVSKAILKELIHESAFLDKALPELKKRAEVTQTIKKLKELGLKSPDKNYAYQVAIWLKNLEQSHFSHSSSEHIQRLKRFYYKRHIIKEEDIPEAYFIRQLKIARQQGHGDIELSATHRIEHSRILISDQKKSLDTWIEYFLSSDTNHYPLWAKTWAFENMVKLGKLDRKTWIFSKRSSTQVAPFIELNPKALTKILGGLVKQVKGELPLDIDSQYASLLKQGNFKKLYERELQQSFEAEGELFITEGLWIKYPMGSEPGQLFTSLEGKNTGWCTAGECTASYQLQAGDFYVYYSFDQAGDATNPRIAIRMEGDEIGEIRGIADNQNVDSKIGETNILKNKLLGFGNAGERYQRRVSDMKTLAEIEQKNNNESLLSIQELRFIYEFDKRIEGFGHQRDPRIDEILSVRDKRNDLAKVFGFRADQISLTPEQALSGGILFHYGDLDLNNLTTTIGLELPREIRGSLYLSKLTSSEGLKLPEIIMGDLKLSNLTSAKGLILPESISGELNLNRLTSAKGLVIPKNIQGGLNLSRLTSAEGLILPRNIKGGLNLGRLNTAEGLVLPETVQWNLILSGLTSTQGLKLPKHVGGNLYLTGLISVEGLKLPANIGGEVYLSKLSPQQLSSSQAVQAPVLSSQ